jgi:putative ABC transport system permease protein
MADIARELRYALRTLRRSPAFTVTSIVVLALAIGANTAMFSVLDAVVLRPLPFPAPEQLVMLWRDVRSQQVREGRSAYRDVEDWRRQSHSFTSLAVFDPASATLVRAGESERIGVLRVSTDIFALLGAQPIAGRVFTSAEADDRQPVALVSERFWRARFGGSRDAIGTSIDLDGRPTRIVGVLPSSVQIAPFDADVWEPHTQFADWASRRLARGAGSWFVLGRLRAGVTPDRAQDEMTSIARRLDAETSPAGAAVDEGIGVVPLRTYVIGDRPRLVLWTLTGAVLCVLLIAATNVASLSLARAAVRERDIAIRAALGASRTRVVRHLLVESLMLVSIAGALGVAIAAAALRGIVSVAPVTLARLSDVGLDARVLGWTSGLCLVTGVAIGLVSTMAMARRVTALVTRESGRGMSSGAATRRARRALVVAQFALAIVLLTGAGLLLRSLWSAERVDLGFRPERLLSLQIATPAGETSASRADVYDRALEQIAALPGVERAAMIGDLFVGGAAGQLVMLDGGASRASQRVSLRRDEVSAHFFETAGVPLRRGRTFSAADGPDAPRVAIVNEAMASRLWPDADPIGKRFALGTAANDANVRQPLASLAATVGGPWFTVIGVAGDMRRQELEREPAPQMFEPLAQNPSRLETVLVRTSSDDPLELSRAVQAAVRRADARVTMYGVTTVERRLGSMLATRQFETSLLLAFAIVALVMAAVGLYGLVQFSVTTRTPEIGIRMAIGADARAIFRMVLREGLALSATGMVIGLLGALWLAHVGVSLLFGVSARDPVTFASVTLVLTAIAAVACGVPARRAMKIDPNAALRQG